MMDVMDRIAHNTKKLREQKKLTLEAAAELTGVSRSMLAQIEKGIVNPTITVLWKIANGLKVPFAALMQSTGDAVTVLRAQDLQPLEEDEGRFLNYPIFLFDESLSFESYRIVMLPSGFMQAEPHMAGVQEFITVFDGQVEITVDEERHTLHAGDSIRFTADVPHSYRNAGESSVQMNMILHYGK